MEYGCWSMGWRNALSIIPVFITPVIRAEPRWRWCEDVFNFKVFYKPLLQQ